MTYPDLATFLSQLFISKAPLVPLERRLWLLAKVRPRIHSTVAAPVKRDFPTQRGPTPRGKAVVRVPVLQFNSFMKRFFLQEQELLVDDKRNLSKQGDTVLIKRIHNLTSGNQDENTTSEVILKSKKAGGAVTSVHLPKPRERYVHTRDEKGNPISYHWGRPIHPHHRDKNQFPESVLLDRWAKKDQREGVRANFEVVEVIHKLGDVLDPVSKNEPVVQDQYRRLMAQEIEWYTQPDEEQTGERFDYDEAPERGWQEGRKDFADKLTYYKWHVFKERDPYAIVTET